MTQITPYQHVLGWTRDLPDHRDYLYSAPHSILATLPTNVDLRPGMPAVYDQGPIGSCFPAGTLIRMADGTERDIEDVRLGEYVITAEARSGMVRQTMLRMETQGLIQLKLWGHSRLRLTKEHPVLTKRGYVQAGEIQLDDFIAMPRARSTDCTNQISTLELISKRERLIKTGIRKMGVIHGRADVAVLVSTVPDQIDLTQRMGRLVGFFLAEGSTSAGKAIWTFGAHEKDTLVAEACDLLTDLDCEAHVQERPNNSINVVVYGTAWARLWERLCGDGAGNKRLHPLLLSGDDSFLEAVFRGWLAGDGYARIKSGRHSRTAGSSVSKKLAMSMFDIAQHLGLLPCFRAENAKQNSSAKHRRNFFTVEINSHHSETDWRSKIDSAHVWRRARAIEHVDFVGPVYNLSVEGDESYVADGIGVHNCTANAIGGAIQFDRMKLNEAPDFIPSRLFIYYNERSLERSVPLDAGAMIRDGIKSVATKGVPSEDLWPYVPTPADPNTNLFPPGSAPVTNPPSSVYGAAWYHKAITYARVTQSLAQLKGCLAQGYPFIFGFSVYSNIYDASGNPVINLNLPSSQAQMLGGHAIIAVGYNDATQMFTIRNSWGAAVQDKGYFYMSYSYVTDQQLSNDFWTIRRETA